MSAGRRILFALFLFVLVSAAAQTPVKKAVPASKPDARAALYALFDNDWDYGMQQNPLFASTLGDRRWNDKLPDASLAAVEKDFAHPQETLKKLAAIDRATLTPADQLNYDLFKHEQENNLEEHKFKTYLLAVDEQNGGIHTLHAITVQLRYDTVKDYRD